MIDDKLVNVEIPTIWAQIDFNGDLKWSHGLTSKIDGGICSDKVKDDERCVLNLEMLLGKKGKSWFTADPFRTPTDMISFADAIQDEEIAFEGTNSGEWTFFLDADKLVNSAMPDIYGVLTPNGRIKWSHGITSEVDGGLCRDKNSNDVVDMKKALEESFSDPSLFGENESQFVKLEEGLLAGNITIDYEDSMPNFCQLTVQALNKQRGKTFNTRDKKKKVIEKIKFSKVKRNDVICMVGQKSRRDCFKMRGERL